MNADAKALLRRLSLLVLSWQAAAGVGAMTVAELQKQLAHGDRFTVIDVRSPTLFARGHIPGAINVPASLCAQKNLPPLGKVVVCDEGLGREGVEAAATALAAKPGITVQTLDGGFAAWESAHALTTGAHGVDSESVNYITYEQLKRAKPDELVLVDLRKAPRPVRKALGAESGRSPPALTDLGQEFPGLRVVPSAFEANAKRLSNSSGAAPLLVLVDNGDGAAQAMARTLKANGIKRYVILTGGELILARHGQRGLQRSGSGFSSTRSATPAPAQAP